MIPSKTIFIQRIISFLQYFGSSVIIAVIQVAVNPLIAKNISPEEYAIIGYYSSFSILLSPFITFFLTNFYIQRFFLVDDLKRNIIKATVMQLLVYLSFGLSVVSLIGLYIYQSFFTTGNISFSPYAFIAILTIPLSGVYSLKLAEYRLQRKANVFAKFTIFAGILSVSLSLLFVVIIKWNAFGKLTAAFIANLVWFIVVIFIERKYFVIKMDLKIVKEALIFCWPLSIAGMLGFFNSGIDTVMLEKLNNLKELGYYTVGMQMASYLGFFSNAVNSTLQPDVYECYSKKNFKRLWMIILLIVTSISIIVILFILFAPIIIKILTAGRYIESTVYSRILALSSITAAIYYSSSQISIAMGYTKLLLIVKIIGVILLVPMFTIAIKNWSFIGAAWANVFSFLLFFIVNTSSLLLLKRKSLK